MTAAYDLALGAAVTVALVAIGGVVVRIRTREPRLVGLELAAQEDAAADPVDWTQLFERLQAVERHGWQGLLLGRPWFAIELWAAHGTIGMRLVVPAEFGPVVQALVEASLPGFVAMTGEWELSRSHVVARVRLQPERTSSPTRTDRRPQQRGVVLRALAGASAASLALMLRSGARSTSAPASSTAGSLLVRSLAWLIGVSVGSVFQLIYATPHERTRPTARDAAAAALADRPGAFQAEVRLRVSAPTPDVVRSQTTTILAALRSTGATTWRPRRVWSAARFDRAHDASRPSGVGGCILRPEQLAELCDPGGGPLALPIAPVRLAGRPRPANAGKVICAIDDGRGTPATLSPVDARHHMHVLGPTGSGKSTLLLNLILDDIAAKRGVGVFDPKGDLVHAVLERLPASAWPRVTLIDPSRRDRPVGLNVLEHWTADDRELACDRLITIFRKTYQESWGPRTDDLLRGAVLTLLHQEDATICEVPLLLLKPDDYRDLIAGLADPIGLGPFWAEYRNRSEAERLQMIGPVLNKLRAVLLRPMIRDILGQARSTFDLGQCMDGGGVLLVSLAKGLLGEETSRLFGAFLIARVWQTAMARADRPEAARPDFVLYLDEFQNYLHLPSSLTDILAEARGYHLGLVLANQHLAQLGVGIRAALSANAGTRVVFRCGQDDARILEREFAPGLSEAQLRALARFQVAVRLGPGDQPARPFTGRTRPEPPGLGRVHAEAAAAAVLERVGRPRAEVERELRARLVRARPVDDPAAALGGQLGGQH